MSITPEMAKAEILRRKSMNSGKTSITPQMARSELERRKSITTESHPPKQEPQEENRLNRAGRSLARIPRNIGAGILDVADFVAAPVREAVNLGSKALNSIGIGSGRQAPPIANEYTKTIDTLTGDYTKPRTNAEKTEESVQRTIGGMPFGGALGNLVKGLKNAPTAIQATGNFLRGSNALKPTNVGGAAATSAAVQSTLNENPEDTMGAITSGIGAGLGASALPSIAGLVTKKGRGNLGTATAQKLGEKLKINPEAIESFKEAGISPTLADVSNSSRLKMISSKLEKLPFVGGPLQEAREVQKKQLLEGLRQGEGELSKAEASTLVKKGAKEYQKGKGNEFNKMFGKVEEDIERLSDSNIGKQNVDKYFEGIFKKIKTSSQQKKFEKSPLGKMYIDLYETAKENGGRIPYEHMKDVLDEINNKITTHGLIGKVDQGKLKQFGSNISKDIETSLEPEFKKLGKDSYSNWKEAKKYYSDYAQNDIPKLNELYKKDKKGATDAFIDLVTNQKKGAEKAKIVLQGLSPKDQVDLTDSIHKQLGRTSDGTFSPLKWVRGYKDLEPQAQTVLLSPLNTANQKKINYIADSIDHMKSTLNEANTSKTAYYTAIGTVATLAARAASNLATGNPLPAVKLASGLFLGKLSSEKLLTNPKFINWMDKGMKAKDMKQFDKILNNPPKVGNLSKILTREIQTFQHDLKQAKKEHEKEEPKKNH